MVSNCFWKFRADNFEISRTAKLNLFFLSHTYPMDLASSNIHHSCNYNYTATFFSEWSRVHLNPLCQIENVAVRDPVLVVIVTRRTKGEHVLRKHHPKLRQGVALFLSRLLHLNYLLHFPLLRHIIQKSLIIVIRPLRKLFTLWVFNFLNLNFLVQVSTSYVHSKKLNQFNCFRFWPAFRELGQIDSGLLILPPPQSGWRHRVVRW